MPIRETRIRGDLIADKEKNPKEFSKALKERWGFYRPVSVETADELSAVLNLAIPDIKRYLKNKRKAVPEIESQDEFGVTFVKRRRVGKQMFRAISGGFRMARAVEALGRSAEYVQEPLNVPLDLEKFAWYTNAERKAVARFADSEGLDRLMEEHDEIERVLGEHGLMNVVSLPDHISLFKYGIPRDNMGLSSHYKKEVLRQVRLIFEDRGLESIQLDPLNVGPNYTEPCDPWERVCS